MVYVPISTTSFDDPQALWAVQVHDAAPAPELSLSVTPAAEPVVIPPEGGSFMYDLVLTNHQATSAAVTLTRRLVLPSGNTRSLPALVINVNGGATFTRSLRQNIPGGAPAGTYAFSAEATTATATVEDGFSFEKSAALAKRGVAGPDSEAHASLSANYPNPFNPVTTISYAVASEGPVRLAVYDLLGREVAVLVDAPQQAGTHHVAFDAGALPTGTYLYHLSAGGRVQTRAMQLLK